MAFDRVPEVTDPKAMRALAHPVRIALLEALTDPRPAHGHRGGSIVGRAREDALAAQLAKYGFVE